jgi:hypothetical protein
MERFPVLQKRYKTLALRRINVSFNLFFGNKIYLRSMNFLGCLLYSKFPYQ